MFSARPGLGYGTLIHWGSEGRHLSFYFYLIKQVRYIMYSYPLAFTKLVQRPIQSVSQNVHEDVRLSIISLKVLLGSTVRELVYIHKIDSVRIYRMLKISKYIQTT